jgi:hypothetical protein
MKNYLVTWTPDNICSALKLLEKYLEEHPSGEHIMQSDSAQIEGLELISDIADIVNPTPNVDPDPDDELDH